MSGYVTLECGIVAAMGWRAVARYSQLGLSPWVAHPRRRAVQRICLSEAGREDINDDTRNHVHVIPQSCLCALLIAVIEALTAARQALAAHETASSNSSNFDQHQSPVLTAHAAAHSTAQHGTQPIPVRDAPIPYAIPVSCYELALGLHHRG